MPQSDVLMFFSQYFWLVLTFFFFIVLLSNIVLPKLANLFFIRSKLQGEAVLGAQSKESKNLPSTSYVSSVFRGIRFNEFNRSAVSVTELSDVDSNYLEFVSHYMSK